MQCLGPAQCGATVVLILRWEAVDDSGCPFPLLDADITLIPDGEHAVLIGLAGAYRPLPAAASGQPTATAVIRAILTLLADAVSDTATATD